MANLQIMRQMKVLFPLNSSLEHKGLAILP